MKQRTGLIKKTTAAALGAFMLLSGTAGSAADIGYILHESSLSLAGGTAYTEITANHSQSGRQQAYYVAYQPGGGVTPVVAYGAKLYGRSDINTVVSYVEGQGKNVVAGINGDFYTLATGVPTGLVITDGILRSSDAWQNAVGFYGDGRAIIGAPQLIMRLTPSDGGSAVSVTYLNKVRTVHGTYLLNEDFSASTRISGSGTDVLLERLDQNPVRVGGTVRMRVVSVTKTSQSSTIPAGHMVLTVDDRGPADQVAAVQALKAGQELTFSATSADTRWNDVTYGVGAGDVLLEGGQPKSGLATAAKPCTALAVKSDGTVILYTVDGRQTGFAGGMSLRDLADELRRLGAVSAVNLDGGGSTTMAVHYPGQNEATVTNSPSDGTLRQNANYILLTNSAQRTGVPAQLYVYPYDAFVLAGASVRLDTRAVDAGYYTATVPAAPDYTLSAPIGTILDGVFTAGAASGSAEVQVNAAGLTGRAKISVFDYMDELKVRKNGVKSYISSLSLSPGEQVDLDAVPILNNRSMYTADTAFQWTAAGDIGLLDANGLLSAASLRGLEGSVTVRYGASAVTIPVTVGRAPSPVETFDAPSSWKSAQTDDGGVLTAAAAKDYREVRYGTGALRLTYQFGGTPEAAPKALELTASPTVKLASNPDYINLWVLGDGSGVRLSVSASDAAGNTLSVTEAQTIDFTGWKQLAFRLPDKAAAVRALVLEGESGKTGTLVVDQMVQSYSDPLADIDPAQITMDAADAAALSATVRDASGNALRAADIKVLLDGRSIPFEYNAAAGTLTAATGTDGALHRVTVQARDAAGNMASASAEFGGSEGGDAVFTDAQSHWARRYAEYLNAQSILTGEERDGVRYFRPDANATREEMAALVSRFAGLDTAAYSDVALPFADANQIAAWALPYVRAVYARGLITGSERGGKLYFDPNNTITRMETMTILGRTLPQGYKTAAVNAADKGKIADWAMTHIEKLMSLEIVSGYPDNTIRPDGRISRAEIATILFRML